MPETNYFIKFSNSFISDGLLYSVLSLFDSFLSYGKSNQNTKFISHQKKMTKTW